jgi:hypothetical protein
MTTHLHPVSRLRISGAKPSFLLSAFTACTVTTLLALYATDTAKSSGSIKKNGDYDQWILNR